MIPDHFWILFGVFPKNKNSFVHVLNIIIKIRKLTLIHYYCIVWRSHSSLLIVPIIYFYITEGFSSECRKEVSATDRGLGWNRSSPEEGARVWAGEGGHPRGGAGGKPDEGAGSHVGWKGHPHRDMLKDKKCHLKGAPSSKSKEKMKHQTNDTNRW